MCEAQASEISAILCGPRWVLFQRWCELAEHFWTFANVRISREKVVFACDWGQSGVELQDAESHVPQRAPLKILSKSPYPSVYSFPHPSGPQAFSMEFNRCTYRKLFSWFQRLWQQVSPSANLGETNAGSPDEMKTRFRMPPDPPLWPSVPSAHFLHLYFSFCFYFPLIKSLINSRFILEHGVTFENF